MFSKVLLHPKFIHFPIALLITGLLIEVYYLWRKKDDRMRLFSNILFLGGLAGALVAVATGMLAESTLGHNSANHELIHEHRNIMLITTTLWLLSTLVLRYMRRWLIISYFILASLVTIGADKGGNLVYKYGIGVTPPKKASMEVPTTTHDHQHRGDHDHKHTP